MTYDSFALHNISMPSQAVPNDVIFLERDMMKLCYHCKYSNAFYSSRTQTLLELQVPWK